MLKITPEIKKIIEENVVSFASTNKIGNPNVIPVGCVKVVADKRLIITDVYMKQTIDNLRENDNVCLAVWDKKWKGYKIIGKADYFTKGKWFNFVKNLPENKKLPVKGAIVVTISRIFLLK